MEDEKIIIYNEENNYESVDVIENTDGIIYDETIQLVEINEPELFTVGVDNAFASTGQQNKQLNHALLHNRDITDQHPIVAITGLREELDGIHALKTVESNKRGYANYYMWKDSENSFPTDTIGYFVSIHTRDHKISIINDSKTEIFGVTVDSAGFVGWQNYDEENKPRDDEYALVATTGVVKVKCRSNVIAGSYVMSDNYGMATVTDNNKYGYYVISIDIVDNQRYAVISLDSTMNQVYQLSEDVAEVKEDLVRVEIKTNAAINAATTALKNSFESDINSALKNSQDALNNAASAIDKVTNLEDGLVSDVNTIKAQIDAIDDSVVYASQQAALKAVDGLIDDAVDANQKINDLRTEISEAKETIDGSLKDIHELDDKMSVLESFNDGTHEGLAGIVTSAQDQAVQLAAISKCLSADYLSIETWGSDEGKTQGQIYYAKDTGLYYYFNTETQLWTSTPEPSEAGLSETIASIRQKTDKDQAMIENLTSYSGEQYETVAEWDRYEIIENWEQKKYLADPYIIYYDESTQLYWQCDINSDTPWSSSSVAPRDGLRALEETDKDKVYYAEDTQLYYSYYNNGWHSSEASTAKLVKSIALIKQTADKNKATIEEYLSYEGPDGDSLAGIVSAVEANKASITSLTSYVQNNYTKLDEWNEEDRTEEERDIIYYAKDPTDDAWKYWYWDKDAIIPAWVGSVNPSDARLSSSLASVEEKVTENEAAIEAFTEWQGDTDTAIAQLKASSSDDGASMESLVMNISKYAVGDHSQAYGLTLADAIELLRDGTVFVATVNVTSESYDRLVELDEKWNEYEKHKALIYKARNDSGDWKYWYWDINTSMWVESDTVENTFTEPRDFAGHEYYIWDKTNGIWVDGGSVNSTTDYIIGDDDGSYLIFDGYYEIIEEKWNSEGKDTDMIYYAPDSDGNWRYWKYWYWNKDDPTQMSWGGVNDYSDTLYITISSRENVKGVNYTTYYVEDKSSYYYYCDDKWNLIQYTKFEIDALYRWNTDDENNPYWQAVATAESNALNRAIAQMRQSVSDTAAEFSVSLTNVKRDLSSVTQTVNAFESTYVTTTVFDNMMTQIEQKSDENEARLSLLVSKGINEDDTWVESDKTDDDKDTVFYVKDTKRYYFWNGSKWTFTYDINSPYIASKIHSAGIIASINDDTSDMIIRAGKIDITGLVTFSDLSTSGKTQISGSNITTGVIKSVNYKSGVSGTQINLTNGTIDAIGNIACASAIFKPASPSKDSFYSEIKNGQLKLGKYTSSSATALYGQFDIGVNKGGAVTSSTVPHVGIISTSDSSGMVFCTNGSTIRMTIRNPGLSSSIKNNWKYPDYTIMFHANTMVENSFLVTGSTTLSSLSVTGEITCDSPITYNHDTYGQLIMETVYQRPALGFKIDGVTYYIIIEPGDPPTLRVVNSVTGGYWDATLTSKH